MIGVLKGAFVRISPDEIATADLSSIKHVYRVGSHFRKADWYQKFNESAHPGIFSMVDAKQHAARRRLFAQSFSNSSIIKFEAQIRQKIDTAISKIRRDATQGDRKTDILKWWTFMATDVIGELSFGTSFNMLEQEKVRSINQLFVLGRGRRGRACLFSSPPIRISYT